MGTKIETKYKVTDRLVIISRNLIEEECKTCDGLRVIKIKNQIFDCPNCGGKGKTETKQHWEIDRVGIPERIVVNIEEGEKPQISYIFLWSDLPEYKDEKDCFLSGKEAQAECDRRNK